MPKSWKILNSFEILRGLWAKFFWQNACQRCWNRAVTLWTTFQLHKSSDLGFQPPQVFWKTPRNIHQNIFKTGICGFLFLLWISNRVFRVFQVRKRLCIFFHWNWKIDHTKIPVLNFDCSLTDLYIDACQKTDLFKRLHFSKCVVARFH